MELVRAVVNGDTHAEEELVRLYRPLILGLARSRYGLKDQDAEDILQSTLLTLWQRDRKVLRAWQGRGRFSTYLTVIVCRLCRHRLTPGRSEGAMPVAATVEDPVPTPAEHTLERERCHEVRQALRDLSPRDRLVLALRYFDDRPPKEFAPALGLSAGAARKAVHDALGRLRRHFDFSPSPKSLAPAATPASTNPASTTLTSASPEKTIPSDKMMQSAPPARGGTAKAEP